MAATGVALRFLIFLSLVSGENIKEQDFTQHLWKQRALKHDTAMEAHILLDCFCFNLIE